MDECADTLAGAEPTRGRTRFYVVALVMLAALAVLSAVSGLFGMRAWMPAWWAGQGSAYVHWSFPTIYALFLLMPIFAVLTWWRPHVGAPFILMTCAYEAAFLVFWTFLARTKTFEANAEFLALMAHLAGLLVLSAYLLGAAGDKRRSLRRPARTAACVLVAFAVCLSALWFGMGNRVRALRIRHAALRHVSRMDRRALSAHVAEAKRNAPRVSNVLHLPLTTSAVRSIAVTPAGRIYVTCTIGGKHRLVATSFDRPRDERWQMLSGDTPRLVTVDPSGALWGMSHNEGGTRVSRLTEVDGHIKASHELSVDGRCSGFAVTDDAAYVSRSAEHTVAAYALDGSLLARWRGEMLFPGPILVDPKGDVLVLDLAGRLRLFTPEGEFVRAWSASPRDGVLLDVPDNVAFDAEGRIVMTGVASRFVHVYNRDGTPRALWRGHPPTPFRFQAHLGVTTDPAGRVYVLDHDAKAVYVFTAEKPDEQPND